MTTVTGLVLAGGKGSRMQGQDKGLLRFRGAALVDHVIARLEPQVDHLLISANRSLADYAQRGHKVVSDRFEGFAGPMAGIATGLHYCVTDWMQVAPCDGPQLPRDLTARLLRGASGHAQVLVPAVARAGGGYEMQCAFMLIHTAFAGAASDYLASGGRRLSDWAWQCQAEPVLFEDAEGFLNLNTSQDLLQHAQSRDTGPS